MDFRILRYFLAVAREQSFTKAAEQLHITQPTLSRNITLTDQGIFFKRRAQELLDLEERKEKS